MLILPHRVYLISQAGSRWCHDQDVSALALKYGAGDCGLTWLTPGREDAASSLITNAYQRVFNRPFSKVQGSHRHLSRKLSYKILFCRMLSGKILLCCNKPPLLLAREGSDRRPCLCAHTWWGWFSGVVARVRDKPIKHFWEQNCSPAS